ncbi:MAG: hypothetical protein Sylvanvirus2_5 [Sylvanvirus sp.]|uniref:Uncharacterized protein n=1 Tax=Sylvanvirus sp. TaxID=2487774 RepID=A0A3G5AKQ3_9VIRU|nr:MAG: hypothetical protein Sylvanvirus2_5 [Sylvanvirus sp.]
MSIHPWIIDRLCDQIGLERHINIHERRLIQSLFTTASGSTEANKNIDWKWESIGDWILVHAVYLIMRIYNDLLYFYPSSSSTDLDHSYHTTFIHWTSCPLNFEQRDQLYQTYINYKHKHLSEWESFEQEFMFYQHPSLLNTWTQSLQEAWNALSIDLSPLIPLIVSYVYLDPMLNKSFQND